MRYLTSVVCLLSFVLAARAEFRLDRSVMSDKYWALWNDEVQAKIDADIEKYRKADAEIAVAAPDGVEVRVEQLTHDFFFGAHAFNFDQLGKREWNERYRELFGTLFNSATVAFYWKTLEPHPGQVRFNAGYEDTEAFWNSCSDPEYQPHWRRPAPAPVVSYMKTRGVRVHGHPLAWGNVEWHLPSWLWDSYCPASEKFALEQASGVAIPGHDLRFPMGVKEKGRDDFTWPEAWKAVFERLSEDEVAALCPTFFAKMNELVDRRIRDIASAYGDRVDSWDVCNESSLDFHGKSVTGRPFQVSPRFGVTAGDLCYRAFKTAEEVLPPKAWYNINDYQMDENYVAQVKDLLAKTGGPNLRLVVVSLYDKCPGSAVEHRAADGFRFDGRAGSDVTPANTVVGFLSHDMMKSLAPSVREYLDRNAGSRFFGGIAGHLHYPFVVPYQSGDCKLASSIHGITNCYCTYGTRSRESYRFSIFVFDTEKGKVHEIRLAGGDKPDPKHPERELRPNRPALGSSAFDCAHN